MNIPAFPTEQYNPSIMQMERKGGMTLRDYFAAKALQGLLANPKLQKEILAQGGCMSGWIEDSAYGFADAMLKAREA
jgi:hypothetical protein